MSRLHQEFRIVQPYGADLGLESTVVSCHGSAKDAFDVLDRIAARILAAGNPRDVIELKVIDAEG